MLKKYLLSLSELFGKGSFPMIFNEGYNEPLRGINTNDKKFFILRGDNSKKKVLLKTTCPAKKRSQVLKIFSMILKKGFTNFGEVLVMFK